MKIIIPLLFFLSITAGIVFSASLRSKDEVKEQGRSLARIDATLKSYLGNPLTGLVYAASLAIGAISILAMYESPLSPLPVPSLPKPPVGRFPPENPVWPPLPKTPVKVKSAAHSFPYAASAVNPIYAVAPGGVIPDHKAISAAVEENNWLGAQNLVSSYSSNGPIGVGVPPRRNDVHAAQLQSYISHMSKIPVIRPKSVTEASPVTSSTPAPNSASVTDSSSSGVSAHAHHQTSSVAVVPSAIHSPSPSQPSSSA